MNKKEVLARLAEGWRLNYNALVGGCYITNGHDVSQVGLTVLLNLLEVGLITSVDLGKSFASYELAASPPKQAGSHCA